MPALLREAVEHDNLLGYDIFPGVSTDWRQEKGDGEDVDEDEYVTLTIQRHLLVVAPVCFFMSVFHHVPFDVLAFRCERRPSSTSTFGAFTTRRRSVVNLWGMSLL